MLQLFLRLVRLLCTRSELNFNCLCFYCVCIREFVSWNRGGKKNLTPGREIQGWTNHTRLKGMSTVQQNLGVIIALFLKTNPLDAFNVVKPTLFVIRKAQKLKSGKPALDAAGRYLHPAPGRRSPSATLAASPSASRPTSPRRRCSSAGSSSARWRFPRFGGWFVGEEITRA